MKSTASPKYWQSSSKQDKRKFLSRKQQERLIYLSTDFGEDLEVLGGIICSTPVVS